MNRLLGALFLLGGAAAFLLFAYGISPDLASRWVIETSSDETGIAVPQFGWFANGLALFVGVAASTTGANLVMRQDSAPQA